MVFEAFTMFYFGKKKKKNTAHKPEAKVSSGHAGLARLLLELLLFVPRRRRRRRFISVVDRLRYAPRQRKNASRFSIPATKKARYDEEEELKRIKVVDRFLPAKKAPITYYNIVKALPFLALTRSHVHVTCGPHQALCPFLAILDAFTSIRRTSTR